MDYQAEIDKIDGRNDDEYNEMAINYGAKISSATPSTPSKIRSVIVMIMLFFACLQKRSEKSLYSKVMQRVCGTHFVKRDAFKDPCEDAERHAAILKLEANNAALFLEVFEKMGEVLQDDLIDPSRVKRTKLEKSVDPLEAIKDKQRHGAGLQEPKLIFQVLKLFPNDAFDQDWMGGNQFSGNISEPESADGKRIHEVAMRIIKAKSSNELFVGFSLVPNGTEFMYENKFFRNPLTILFRETNPKLLVLPDGKVGITSLIGWNKPGHVECREWLSILACLVYMIVHCQGDIATKVPISFLLNTLRYSLPHIESRFDTTTKDQLKVFAPSSELSSELTELNKLNPASFPILQESRTGSAPPSRRGSPPPSAVSITAAGVDFDAYGGFQANPKNEKNKDGVSHCMYCGIPIKDSNGQYTHPKDASIKNCRAQEFTRYFIVLPDEKTNQYSSPIIIRKRDK